MSSATFTREAALAWMRSALRDAHELGVHSDHAELLDGGEVNLTRLAEDCADAFGEAAMGGPLDDDGHWIWETAIEAADDNDRNEED